MEAVVLIFLILLLSYYALKFLLKLLMPRILRFIAKKFQQKMERSFHQQTSNRYQQEEIHYNQNPKKSQKSNKTVGEYIDFEEID